MSPAEAARRRWERHRERLASGDGTARDLRQEIRSALEDDADAVLEAVRKAIREGRDVRALTSLLDRVYGPEKAQAVPRTVAEVEAMTSDQLAVLIAQLDAELGIEGAAPTSQLLASGAEEGMDTGEEA